MSDEISIDRLKECTQASAAVRWRYCKTVADLLKHEGGRNITSTVSADSICHEAPASRNPLGIPTTALQDLVLEQDTVLIHILRWSLHGEAGDVEPHDCDCTP